jgi:tRNA (guanosine-2'-O-)-methyltransferase
MNQSKLEYLEGFISDQRKQRFLEVLQQRTRYITVALEDVYHAHNSSAVIRSCDVFGIQDIHLILSRFGKKLDGKISRGAQKWVDVQRHTTTTECLNTLRGKGYRIVATSPHGKGYTPDKLPLDVPVALFFGTEKEGISETVQNQADLLVRIPMLGFTESLNVSVAAAILLNQLGHRLRSSNLPWPLSEAEILDKRFDWTYKSVRSAQDVMSRYREY